MSFAKGVLASKVELGGRDGLAAAAELLHKQCFDPVELGTPSLSYEPRASCHCKDCCAVWIAWKTGHVMCVDLNSDPPAQSIPEPGKRAARAIDHVHDGSALGGGSLLLVGRDDGEVEVVACRSRGPRPAAPRPPGAPPLGFFHVGDWAVGQTIAIGPSVPRRKEDPMGITAIAAASWGRPDTLDILVATRRPELHVLEATRGTLTVRQRRPMPGWIQWILVGEDRVTCVSRGGDIARFTREELLADDRRPPARVPLLPTAAMMFDRNSVLLGTMKGLFLVRDGQRALAVPVTQSPVLCLARTQVTPRDGLTHDYITMGLEGGRLRVADAELVRALADGGDPPPEHDHNFGITISDAVLAVETLQLDPDSPHTAHVMTMTRDQSVRLFHVTTQEAPRDPVQRLWKRHLEARGATSFDAACDAIRDSLSHGDRAWRYMLADVVLPDLAGNVPDCMFHGRIVELACAIADRTRRTDPSDRFALYALSAHLHDLTGGDVDLQLALSRSILRAVGRTNDARWTAFIESHLRQLNALPRPRSDGDFDRRVQWTRFVRKFILLGHTFAAKRIGLGKLVQQNYEIGKYLDALIYQARLFQRRYDLLWRRDADDVAELHAVECAGGGSVVVIVTADGALAFADGETGRPIPVAGGQSGRLTAVADGRAARTLASAIAVLDRDPDAAREATTFRVVLATDAQDSPPPSNGSAPRRRDLAAEPHANGWLAVFDLRWSPDPGVIEVVARTSSVPCETGGVRVRAVKPLPPGPPRQQPRRQDVFVVGLETSAAPVGRLWRSGEGWRLELAHGGATQHADPASAGARELSLAPGKVPTRGLAVAYDDAARRYLAVAGSDDGVVRAVSFAPDAPASSWQVRPWDRVPDAVSSIALIRYRKKPRRDTDPPAPEARFSCYLGTGRGDTYALSILVRRRRDDDASGGSDDREASATVLRFADYDAEALWRDTHEGPVVRAGTWHTSLYPPLNDAAGATDAAGASDVLFVVTEHGRLCFYQHAGSDSPDDASAEYRHSASYNYFFRGLRLDRLSMPSQLRALTMVGDHKFVAAGPAGPRNLYMGKLVFLRNSKDRPIPDYRRPTASGRAAAPPAAAPGDDPPRRLPSEIWESLAQLFERSRIAQPFGKVTSAQLERLKFDMCDLVRVEGGALSGYILRRRWPKEALYALHGDELRAAMRELLGPLDPEQREDAEQIKISIKLVCRPFLFYSPSEIKREIVKGVDPMAAHHAQLAVVCDFLRSYVRSQLAASTDAAARLRVVLIKELLRVATLRRMAVRGDADRDGQCIHDAVESVLETCLHDDQPLVRVEAMRALSVMLRNVGMMAGEHDDPDRKKVLDALLPHRLDSLDWVLRSTVGGLLRFPSFTSRTALFSGASHLIWGLLPLFHIFPDRTLALCDHLIREGLGVEVLAMCARSLRGERMAHIRQRIEYLYLLPARTRDHFNGCYRIDTEAQKRRVAAMKLASPVPRAGLWHELDDNVMAHALIELLDRLAQMSDVKDLRMLADQVATSAFEADASDAMRAVLASADPSAADRGAPLGWLVHIVDELIAAAGRLVGGQAGVASEFARLLQLFEPPSDPGRDRPRATARIRTVGLGIVEQWRTIVRPPLKTGSTLSSIYTVGARRDDASNALWSVCSVSGPRLEANYEIRIFEQPNHKSALQRFLKGAKIHHELAKRSDHLVEVREVMEHDRAYIVRKHRSALEQHLTAEFAARGTIEGRDALHCAYTVARQIGGALEAVHAAGHYHGDVRAGNILLSAYNGVPAFHLGGFYQADPPASEDSGPRSIVPSYLAHLCELRPSSLRGPAGLSPVQWLDVAALALVLHRMLTGEQIDPRSDANLEPAIRTLQALGNRDHVVARPEARRVIEAVMRVFGGDLLDVHAFCASLQPKTRVLWLMANPVASAGEPPRARPLDLEGELRSIRALADYHPEVELSDHAVDPEALLTLVRTRRASIVHFSGHGTERGIVVREHLRRSDGGYRDLPAEAGGEDAHEVTGATLAAAFETWRPRLVVLNACYSDRHAEVIAARGLAVVGTTHRVHDTAACGFSLAFYRALFGGATVREAFKLATDPASRDVFRSHGDTDIKF